MRFYTFKFYTFFIVFIGSFGYAQTSDKDKVVELLTKVQESFQKSNAFSYSMNYSMYPTYNGDKASESFNGAIIKNKEYYYTKIHQTVFLTSLNGGSSIKLNSDEKIILVGDINLNTDQNVFEMLSTFANLFKDQTLVENDSYWICSFTSDVITQIPYGKIEVFINKKDYSINKQVFYFLSQLPYKNDKGLEVMGNPRLEVTFDNYKKSIDQREEQITELSYYITKNKVFAPTSRYKDFQIIQN